MFQKLKLLLTWWWIQGYAGPFRLQFRDLWGLWLIECYWSTASITKRTTYKYPIVPMNVAARLFFNLPVSDRALLWSLGLPNMARILRENHNKAEDKEDLIYHSGSAWGLRLGDDAVFFLATVERKRCLGIVTGFYQSRRLFGNTLKSFLQIWWTITPGRSTAQVTGDSHRQRNTLIPRYYYNPLLTGGPV